GILPDEVRWRRIIGGHPGWTFHETLMRHIDSQAWGNRQRLRALNNWLDLSAFEKISLGPSSDGYATYRALILSHWLDAHNILNSCRLAGAGDDTEMSATVAV